MSYKSYQNKLTQGELYERHHIMSDLIEASSYFSYLPYFEKLCYNIEKYSNEFIKNIALELKYGTNFEGQTELKQLYDDFLTDYQKAYHKWAIEANQQQQQEYSYQEQPQAYTQGQYSQQAQYGQYAQQQQYSQYNQQGQYGQYGQQFNNQPYQQTYPQGYQQPYQQQHYTQDYSQTGYQNSQQGRTDRRNQGNYNREHPRDHHGQSGHHKGDKKFHERNSSHEEQQPIKKHSVQYKEHIIPDEPSPVKEPEPEPQPAPEPEKQVEPPKPQPKPMKFSIEQIKEFINSVSKEELEKHANPQVVAKAKELKEWKCQQVEVKLKEENKPYDKKGGKRDDPKNANIRTGVRKDEAKEAERMGYRPAEDKKVMIVVGAKETLETRQMKEELKKKAFDFVSQKQEEEKLMHQVEKDRKEIVYNLNLIVPENLKDIEKDLWGYLLHSEEVCKVMIQQIIKKAWDQPKYASTYAKLCSDFAKRPPSDFHFEGAKKEKDNPFKFLLIERVQHSFDQKIDKFPQFESPEDKELFLKEFKKKILSNVKFIAELILCRILKKRTIKYCISQLFESFLRHYYAYVHDNKIEDSVYDYHYEAIIEFIENIGEKYEGLEEKEKERDHLPYEYNEIKNHIDQVLKVATPPHNDILDKLGYFSGDQYFELLDFINFSFMKNKFPRLGALLQNLEQRRRNNWERHYSAHEGPKKLKDIQDEIEREEKQIPGKEHKQSKERLEQEKLDKKVKELFEGWEIDKHDEERDLRDLYKKHNDYGFYLSFLKQVADQKKDLIAKRMSLFPFVVDHERFNSKEFKRAWIEAIKYLAFGSGDFPFCGAALAKILQASVEKKVGKLQEFYSKFEDEDEEFFMEEIIQKYHFYSKDEGALKYVKPKSKYSGLI